MQTLCIVRFIMEYSSNSEYKIWCFDKVFWSWSEHVLCVIIFRLFSTAGYQYIYLARKLSECLTKSGYLEIHGPCTNVCVFMCNYNVSLIFLTALFLFWKYIIKNWFRHDLVCIGQFIMEYLSNSEIWWLDRVSWSCGHSELA